MIDDEFHAVQEEVVFAVTKALEWAEDVTENDNMRYFAKRIIQWELDKMEQFKWWPASKETVWEWTNYQQSIRARLDRAAIRNPYDGV